MTTPDHHWRKNTKICAGSKDVHVDVCQEFVTVKWLWMLSRAPASKVARTTSVRAVTANTLAAVV